jgi:hypothetical protein
LPEWNSVIKKLATEDDNHKTLVPRIMPRDVSTRWNSTYDMLKFTYSYRVAINRLTDNRSLNLGHCVISELEWGLVRQLRDVLKVRRLILSF